MRILITGSSSFTGMHFIEALAQKGHHITALFSQPQTSYTGIAAIRMRRIQHIADCQYNIPYGTDIFLDVVQKQNVDVYCHHWSYTKNYQHVDFDLEQAIQKNTKQIVPVLKTLSKHGCTKIAVTGSIFSGFRSEQLSAQLPFSPYGLSKKIQSEIFHLYGDILGLDVRTFVIPNPFGAFDNRKMVSIFLEQWLKNNEAQVFIPKYIRDNIHVELLAQSYAWWIDSFVNNPQNTNSIYLPSGYQMSVASFVEKLAQEMRPRLQVPCLFHCLEQRDFTQPLELINQIDVATHLQISTDQYWDNIAQFALTYLNSERSKIY